MWPPFWFVAPPSGFCPPCFYILATGLVNSPLHERKTPRTNVKPPIDAFLATVLPETSGITGND